MLERANTLPEGMGVIMSTKASRVFHIIAMVSVFIDFVYVVS